MVQDANWETARGILREAQVGVHAWCEDVSHTVRVGNTLVVDFEDGSQLTFTASITKDAS